MRLHSGATLCHPAHSQIAAARVCAPRSRVLARGAQGLTDGFNAFLRQLDVTFRRDPVNFRPRVNKKNSAKDREQKASGQYFVFDAEEDPADKADAKENATPRGKGKK